MNRDGKPLRALPRAADAGESQAELAFARIEELIASLELAPGAPVSEAILGARIGLGRTPVRMALRRLEHMGLVSSLPNKGVFIRPMNLEDQLAILEVRRPLERMLAAKAARLATAEQRGRLRVQVEAMLAAARAGDRHGYLRCDQACDEVIYETARNPYAVEFAALLYTHSRRYWVARAEAAHWLPLAELHRDMMFAIAEGDEGRAMAGSDALLDYLEARCKASAGLLPPGP